MPPRSSKLAETWRVLAYTLAIALAFIALERAQLALFTAPGTTRLLQRIGWLDADPAARLQQEAAQVAAASRDALQRLPSGHRLATLRLGYALGYTSQLVGVIRDVAAGGAGRGAAARRADAGRGAPAGHGTGPGRGAGAAGAQPARVHRTGRALRGRRERPGARASKRSCRRCTATCTCWARRSGGEMARVEDSGGQFALPPATPIRRHAVLAGIDAAVWQPLIVEPRDETPAQVVQRYRARGRCAGGRGRAPGSPPTRRAERRGAWSTIGPLGTRAVARASPRRPCDEPHSPQRIRMPGHRVLLAAAALAGCQRNGPPRCGRRRGHAPRVQQAERRRGRGRRPVRPGQRSPMPSAASSPRPRARSRTRPAT